MEPAVKTKKAFALIGKKLEKVFKKYGFKYAKKYKHLKKTTKKYDYYIFFSSFFECIPDACIELHVVLLINEKVLLKNHRNVTCQVFSMNLWDTGSHYNIANETLINEVFADLKKKVEDNLIPYIKRLAE
jgi:hypothetical protein